MVCAFLPCRVGSKRVVNKNIRPFGNVANGLFEIKLRQLASVRQCDRILVSSNDDKLIDICTSLTKEIDADIIIDRRPDEFGSDSTSTDDLIRYAISIVPDDVILWTHVTSPFVGSHRYSQMIDKYEASLDEGYDSLMSVNVIRTFLWNKDGPINYDKAIEKWPRTQTIEPVYEINSAAFLCDRKLMQQENDRIGRTPFLFELHGNDTIDIDWEEDFDKAEIIWNQTSLLHHS